ncbi:MAG: sulfatase-like hydrolase/transferase [Lentimonas sp.]
MKSLKTLFALAGYLCCSTSFLSAADQAKPNVLWILTDDQRYDSIQAFNRILHGRDHSALGYVESPNVDRLAERGTTFINTYVHAQGCAPSRASMHYGRYPHHTGIYEFEYHNNNVAHMKPTMPEFMKELDYQTMHVGKLGVRIRTVVNGKAQNYSIYEQDINFKKMWMEGLTDWTKGERTEVNGVKLPKPVHGDWLFSPDGSYEFTGVDLNELPGWEGHSKRVDEKYDLIRMDYGQKSKGYGGGEILGGVSPQPDDKTRDGHYLNEMTRYLENPNAQLTVGSQSYKGVDPSKPLFLHLGFDFPHTPVLPTQAFRERFQSKKYDIPEFDPAEVQKLPAQLSKIVNYKHSDHFTEAKKQQMVQDYFAFCAYGDSLVGQASDAFIEYSEQQKQPWMIVYVCGDHGWKLNEHGALSKFTPWQIDSLNPIVVVSSDTAKFPAGKVVHDLTEFVDIMPTVLAAGGADLQREEYAFLDGYDLAKVASGALPARDYIVGESHAVTGPRATIRTKDYMFSIKSRPHKKRGVDMEWALTASYEALEPMLYHLPTDPSETNNLAHNPEYAAVAQKMKEKLLSIVIEDARVEINWEQWGTGMDATVMDPKPSADDKRLKL